MQQPIQTMRYHSIKKLYPHQQEAIEQMRNGCILCGGTGSGKSMTSLAYYFEKVCEEEPVPLFIITTARKRDTGEWEDECLNFATDNGFQCTIDSWNNIKKYADVKDSMFIFDEQRVVGSGTWAKTFIKITKSNKWILLSATPGDTYSDYIPVFIANGFYKNRSEFIGRHVVYSRFSKYPKIERYLETKYLDKLRDSILVDMDAQRSTEPIRSTELCEYDKELYKEVNRNRWNPYTNQPIKNANELCLVLRRIVNSDPSRVYILKQLLNENNKAIIFYNFDYELEILRNVDYGKNYTVAEWNGHKHDPIPNTTHWVYLVQYTAGAEGWNCITTNQVIFYSLNYSWRTMLQAEGRIDRLNTPYHFLYYYKLKSQSPIDNAIIRALNKKQDFNAKHFAGGNWDNGQTKERKTSNTP